MKYLLLIYLLVSCNTISRDPEGMYTCKYENEFAKVQDTLWIRKLSDNYYKAERSSGILYSNNRKKMVAEVWKLQFNGDVFTDVKTGSVIIWGAGVLKFANRTYRKL